METLGAFPDGEWDCFRRMFAIEEHDVPQFHGQSSLLLGEVDGNIGIQSMFCSTTPESRRNIESMFYSLDADNSDLQHISQESSHSSNGNDHNVFIANPGGTNCYFGYPDHVLASLTDIVMEENVSLNEDRGSNRSENSDHTQVEPIVLSPKQLQLKRKPDLPELKAPVEDEININSSGNQKKKTRGSKDVQRCMKNTLSKNQKLDTSGNEAEESNAGSDGQGSSSYTSEDDNANQENSGGATSASQSTAALNSSGKTRAGRGSATDPQSLYARKRRERINERLRILQNLVPSGTKVDISTMLEEAVHYVKFLQLQIKLLSSDDLWIYAPIAYNGLDIGLDLSKKISRPL